MAKKTPKKKAAKKNLAAKNPAAVITPRHQWTHIGTEVLIVKSVGAGGTTFNGFQWPLTVGAEVVAPDWQANPECGHGLHGWPWGFFIGDGKSPDWFGTWIVFGAPADTVVDLGGKVKVPRGVIRFVGTWGDATSFVLSGQMAWIVHASTGAATASGP